MNLTASHIVASKLIVSRAQDSGIIVYKDDAKEEVMSNGDLIEAVLTNQIDLDKLIDQLKTPPEEKGFFEKAYAFKHKILQNISPTTIELNAWRIRKEEFKKKEKPSDKDDCKEATQKVSEDTGMVTSHKDDDSQNKEIATEEVFDKTGSKEYGENNFVRAISADYWRNNVAKSTFKTEALEITVRLALIDIVDKNQPLSKSVSAAYEYFEGSINKPSKAAIERGVRGILPLDFFTVRAGHKKSSK